ncbi:hypothetical protein BKA70DRAFT_826009 [Coprinopsis sp. MPI-PUGE-AT-0042]|nr:hypothetical protein BKA70DRAFT_826009 [Coprinopsis sp. MPI-PUGE-AT-0042]
MTINLQGRDTTTTMADDAAANGHEKTLLSPETLQLSGPSPGDPTLGNQWLPNQSAPILPSSAGLFQGSSGNALSNSTANVATHGDILNVGTVNIHLPQPSHAGQGPSSLPQSEQQPFSRFSYILSTITDLATRTAVTLGSPTPGAPYPRMPSNPLGTPGFAAVYPPDTTVLGSENNHTYTSESITIESGDFEITLLDDLDMEDRHQPRAWYRSSDLPNGLTLDGIYIRKIYPNGHGYPCPNPCPEGPPVRIGDIGELTSAGFAALANLADCQLPSLQGELAALALSDPWHEPNYFSEGQSIMGGVAVDKTRRWLGVGTIRTIEYRCRAPQGAILAVTSPAQLHTLPHDRNHRLRSWLCKHGMELLQSIDPGRTDPLYIVTGKVTSSSWATATYSEPMTAPDDVLVLARSFYGLPPYYWSEPGASRNWSKVSSNVNPGGERASDQCLFLRGFLLTPSSKHASREARHAVKTDNGIPDTSASGPHQDVGTMGGPSAEGSSQPIRSFPNQSGGSPEVAMGERAWSSGRDDLLIEEVPSLSSMRTAGLLSFVPNQQTSP